MFSLSKPCGALKLAVMALCMGTCSVASAAQDPLRSFDPLYYPYPAQRNVVYGSRGMVATSNPLAAQAVGLVQRFAQFVPHRCAALRHLSYEGIDIVGGHAAQQYVEDGGHSQKEKEGDYQSLYYIFDHRVLPCGRRA